MSPTSDSHRDSLVRQPVLRKDSQADDIILGNHPPSPSRGDSLSPQRFFQRSVWSRSPSSRINVMSAPQYSYAPSSITSPVSSPAPTKSLTDHIVEHQPYLLELATRAPFLVAAGTGTLSKATLSQWLSQDRLYAQAFIGFIGSLLSRVDLPYAHVNDKNTSLRWRIVNLLTTSLENIHKELAFFEDVAKRYGLNLESPPYHGQRFTAHTAARDFIELFRAFWTDPTMTLLDGLVVLWTTEFCYLRAWKYAASHLNPERMNDLDGGALRKEFIPNWTSPQFEKFVEEIKECTDLLAEREDAGTKLDVYKGAWVHVLEIERQFWPEL